MKLPSGWCCYLLLCCDGRYYCGISVDLKARVRHHASGKGSRLTKEFKPIALVWFEKFDNRHAAAQRERQIKNWSRLKKAKLADGVAPFNGLGNCLWVPLGSARG